MRTIFKTLWSAQRTLHFLCKALQRSERVPHSRIATERRCPRTAFVPMDLHALRLLRCWQEVQHTCGPEALEIVDYVYFMSDGVIVTQGTPTELRASDKPFVHQFVYGETDGPMPFHYPADDYARDLHAGDG